MQIQLTSFHENPPMTTSAKLAASEPSAGHGLKLSESIAAIMRGLARDYTRSLERRLSGHNVTVGMWFPLRILWEEDGITQNVIQQRLGMAQPTLVLAFDRLARRGLIERRRSTIDRRKVHIHLTREGKELEKEILKYADDVQAIATRNVTKREVETLHRVFRKMRKALDDDHASIRKAGEVG